MIKLSQAVFCTILKIMLYKSIYNSPIGKITLASDGENLVGAWIEGQKYFANSTKEELHLNNNPEIFQNTKIWLDKYFQGQQPDIKSLSLAPSGSDFRQSVWKILCEIPYGQTTTYGEIAKQIATEKGLNKMSAQAIGGAVGHNPISIIIPCHRVIGSNGNLTGYAGGIDLKIILLKHENSNNELF